MEAEAGGWFSPTKHYTSTKIFLLNDRHDICYSQIWPNLNNTALLIFFPLLLSARTIEVTLMLQITWSLSVKWNRTLSARRKQNEPFTSNTCLAAKWKWIVCESNRVIFYIYSHVTARTGGAAARNVAISLSPPAPPTDCDRSLAGRCCDALKLMGEKYFSKICYWEYFPGIADNLNKRRGWDNDLIV